ncbi:MAG TPA: hypothetical protein VKZ79_16185 [Alphaproteobacteria bacterium]|nr:hypothetical protein [Alphaproteobacteria bacterium]
MTTPPELALTRLLQAFEAELIEAMEEEIVGALSDLGMSASINGSAALIDVKYSAIRRHLEAYGVALTQPASEEDEDMPVRHLPGALRHDQ